MSIGIPTMLKVKFTARENVLQGFKLKKKFRILVIERRTTLKSLFKLLVCWLDATFFAKVLTIFRWLFVRHI